ncbi:Pycsar system effector family protein [Lentzea sp. NPDC042327]|uniref:Pycsar system effector family protein n=1 Tax=Lentzea sp. NPDC042327 TaxID=3154801 RepID=UPI0033CB2B5E
MSDAELAIEQSTTWIKNADVKAGLCATAVAGVATAVASQRPILGTVAKSAGVVNVLALVALGLSAAALIASAFFLVKVLLPRTAPGAHSRYSWPSLAQLPLDDLMSRTPAGEEAGWAYAQTLARIAQAKYRSLRWALMLWFVSATLLITWLVVAS